MFVKHRLDKEDNLAGLAVKYNVTVSDIKRANGFLSDSAMFGQDTILIPTGPLPFKPEYSAWAGMIVAHYGRLPHGKDGGHLRPASLAALDELRGYYSMDPGVHCSPGTSDDDEPGPHSMPERPGRRRSQRQGEVELMTRQQGFQPAAGSYAEDRLRRRNNGGDTDGESDPGGSVGLGQEPPPPLAPRLPTARSAAEGRRSLAQVGSGLPDLRDLQRRGAAWRDQVLSKLKKVASQPVLGALQTGLREAAGHSPARPSSMGGASPPRSGHSAAWQRIKRDSKAD